MTSMSTFLSVRALHEEGTPKKEIARQLGVDRRTVRKYIRRIELGADQPNCRPPATRLEPFLDNVACDAYEGLSATKVYQPKPLQRGRP